MLMSPVAKAGDAAQRAALFYRRLRRQIIITPISQRRGLIINDKLARQLATLLHRKAVALSTRDEVRCNTPPSRHSQTAYFLADRQPGRGLNFLDIKAGF